MTEIISIGVIGTGGIAQSHIRSIKTLENIRLTSVMDVDETQAKKIADQHGVRSFTKLENFINDQEIDAVLICTPHYLHADQAIATANAGKHVFVEKPMALSVAECDQMINASENAEKILMIGQVMRHYPVNLTIKRLIADGEIGEVGHLIRRRYSYFNPTSPNDPHSPWYLDLEKAGNCVLYGFGSHEYDLLPWYLDSPIVQVYAQGTESTELYRGQADSFTSIMNHENGAISVLTQSVVCHSSAHDQFIIGSRGSMMMSGNQLKINGKTISIDGTNSEGMPNQIRDFAECCLTGRQPDASGKSVRHTMAVIEATQISAKEDQPIKIP